MVIVGRRDLKTCPVINNKKVCGGRMNHVDDHSECLRCGFFLRKGEKYDKRTRKTLI